MWSDPPKSEQERRKLIQETRKWMFIPLAVGVVLASIFSYVLPSPRSITPPVPSPTLSTVTAGASPSATVGRDGSASTTPAAANPPPSTPRVLPASNAFTTMEDYRQRRVHALHTPEPLTPPPAGRSPQTELDRTALLVRDYRAAYGANPVGNNREIVRTLLGDNPRGTKFLDPSTITLNERGEWLDAWGHPYFFHALSGTAMEIRSAGPDGKAFTPDDLVR